MKYNHRFINPNLLVPKDVQFKINNDFPNADTGVRHCLGLIITNMSGEPINISKSSRHYTKNKAPHYTKANILKALALGRGKLFIVDNGFRNISYPNGISTTIRPLEGLFDYPLFNRSVDLSSLPLITYESKPINSIKDISNKDSKPSITPMPYTALPLVVVRKSLVMVKILNDSYFSRINLDYKNLRLSEPRLEKVRLTRIFKHDGCGRLYQKGGYSYQGLSEKERALTLLNELEVAELDYSAMHPHFLYAWEGKQCPDNFYEMIAEKLGVEYNQDTKFVIKRVTLSAINASSEVSLKKAIAFDKRNEYRANDTRRKEGRAERPILFDELKRLGIDYKDIVEAFREAHPTIAKYIYSNSANKLMLDESNIMMNVLWELMNDDILAIPVFDSLLFPKQYQDVVRQVMLEQYKKYTGFNIVVK